MEFIQCGYNYVERPMWCHTPSTSTDYSGKNRVVLLLVRSKMRVFHGNDQCAEYDENTLVISSSGQYIKFAAKPPYTFVNDWVEFFAESEFLLENFGLGTGIIIPNINEDIMNELSQIVHVMYVEYTQKGPLSLNMIKANLDILLIKISRYISSINNGIQVIDYSHPEYAAFSKMRDKIISCKSENELLNLSSSLGMSISTFKRHYKTIFGCSIKRDAVIHRIQKSKSLLIETDMSLYEISDMLGYSTYELFFKQFKQSEGISPKSYREIRKKGFYISN